MRQDSAELAMGDNTWDLLEPQLNQWCLRSCLDLAGFEQHVHIALETFFLKEKTVWLFSVTEEKRPSAAHAHGHECLQTEGQLWLVNCSAM